MFKFIGYKNKKKDKGFCDLQDDKIKAFRIKKMFNELPVLGNLKTRFPKIYKLDICPRCLKGKETISHLWECDKANNNMVILCSKVTESLKKILRKRSKKFFDVELLIDEIFPFGRTSKLLKENTKERFNFYKRFDRYKFRPEFKYVWNNKSSIDHLLRGRIPFSLINLLRSHLKKNCKKTIKDILFRWLGKIDHHFFENIWKPRNDDILRWEEQVGITKKLKRGLPDNKRVRKRGETRKLNKINYSGRKKLKVHALDDQLALYVRNLIGLNPFHLECGQENSMIFIVFKIVRCARWLLW
jgi:hypothetical protein